MKPESGARGEWSPDAAYADALAELHSVVEKNFSSDAALYLDAVDVIDAAGGGTGRHGLPNRAEPDPRTPGASALGRHGIDAARGRRKEHAHERIREPLVNGTRASDLFLLLQRHGDLDLPRVVPERSAAANEETGEPQDSKTRGIA